MPLSVPECLSGQTKTKFAIPAFRLQNFVSAGGAELPQAKFKLRSAIGVSAAQSEVPIIKRRFGRQNLVSANGAVLWF